MNRGHLSTDGLFEELKRRKRKSAMRREKTRDSEVWKEQFGFVSGTVLVWAGVLIQSWPTVAHMQSNTNIRLIPAQSDWAPSVSVLWYEILTLGLALGLGVLIFGAVHVIARGLWLVRRAATESATSARLSHWSYQLLHFYWRMLAVYLVLLGVLVVMVAIIDYFLVQQLGLARLAARLIMVPVVVALFMFAIYRMRRRLRLYFQNVERKTVFRNAVAVTVIVTLCWTVTTMFCNVATLSVDRHVYEKARDSYIVANVELGGATSRVTDAKLFLLGQHEMQRLPLQPVGEGQYVAIVPISRLRNGTYVIRLYYPHVSASLNVPPLRSTILRESGIVVAP
jgi:hypothetical protein